MNKILLILGMLIVSSCASHSLMKGTVALKIDEKNGVACMDTSSLKPGSKLTVANNNCSRVPFSKNESSYCQLVTVGEIEITKILNDHYTEFQTVGEFKFEEGSILKPSK